MNDTNKDLPSNVTWFVGACYGGSDDQTERFLSEGIWESGHDKKHLDVVKSMQPGERIAIKSTYTRKLGLPFDNRGHVVSVMGVKATGIITENFNDGKRLKVNWISSKPVREWFFYTYRETIWRVQPSQWEKDALIAFAFDGQPQDLDRFRNAPYWRERFGTMNPNEYRFVWTKFYTEMADKLLAYRHNRPALITGLQDISTRVEGFGHLTEDKYPDGSTGFVRDICPFTTFGLFNRGIKKSNRKIVAAELAKFLGVDEAVPEAFDGIPLLNNLKSWYFPPEVDRDADHIDALWEVFAAAIAFADSTDEDASNLFAAAFDNANGRYGVSWNLTMGLYWIRPYYFLSLDKGSQNYIANKLDITIGRHGPKRRCNSSDYLAVMDALELGFQEDSYPVHSFPELSFEAWGYKVPTTLDNNEEESDDDDEEDESVVQDELCIAPAPPYSIEKIIEDGCFLSRPEIEQYLDRLNKKKNLILQGPPGTGKTWLAKRLAYALIGYKDPKKVRAVQFHPNLSYEDFVRGWRPTGDGKLSLADGIFMEAIQAAKQDKSSKYVMVIEEINRGNPVQIFGEMLTLLEASKRNPDEALELCYSDGKGPVYIPDNLYVIGTMNIADRSLALVDLALRRRFAFVELEPNLNRVWRDWVVEKLAVDLNLITEIERRIVELNKQIAEDNRLGKQFRVGHSYVTPDEPLQYGTTKEWFTQVVDTEIGPLLDEYWFDAPDEAQSAIKKLKQDW